MKKAVIIGSGMGGLAAALRLQHNGFQVEVFEKNERPGGRSNILAENGFRVDMGPTILVMKQYFDETYAAIGEDINQRLQFTRLDPNYRIYYHDGSHLDLYGELSRLSAELEQVAPQASSQFYTFLGDNARKYRYGMQFVDRNFDRITDLANPAAILRLLQTRAHQNLYRQVSRYFDGNDKLTKAFSFHSMFLGLSPYDALAMYSLITYADLAFGMWYPQGGIYSIVEDMLALAAERGIKVHTAAPVRQILIENKRAVGVLLENGEKIPADLVISNADLPYTWDKLVPAEHQGPYRTERLKKMDYACSGYLMYLGVDTTYPDMRHQALYFSEDYRANLDAIFRTRTLPDDPSFHLNNPTQTDPSLAPEGHQLLYVLAPAPNLQGNVDWTTAGPVLREKLLKKLEQVVDPQIRRHIVWERNYTPLDFQSDYNAVQGTAFGSLSHGLFQSAYFRPHNTARHLRGLYFVGQGTYPGIGMPMVLISARLVTERIMKEMPA